MYGRAVCAACAGRWVAASSYQPRAARSAASHTRGRRNSASTTARRVARQGCSTGRLPSTSSSGPARWFRRPGRRRPRSRRPRPLRVRSAACGAKAVGRLTLIPFPKPRMPLRRSQCNNELFSLAHVQPRRQRDGDGELIVNAPCRLRRQLSRLQGALAAQGSGDNRAIDGVGRRRCACKT